MRILIAIATLLVLTVPASALCLTRSDGGDNDGYPRGKEALLLCQQTELSEAINDRAVAERLRAMRAQLQALQFRQQRLLVKPFATYELPRF